MAASGGSGTVPTIVYPYSNWRFYRARFHTCQYLASDNLERIAIASTFFKELDQQVLKRYDGNKAKDANPFLKWHIYPVTLINGYNNLTVEAWNIFIVAVNAFFASKGFYLCS